jgi:hypothetical protein
MPRPATTLFEDAIDVPMWLEADRRTPYTQRIARDREIARRLPPANPIRRVRGWWRDAGADSSDATGARLERLRALLTFVMVILGAAAGIAVALAAFHYDGSQPVNVVRLFALLVGLPLLFLLLTLLLIPGRVPGLRGFQDALAAINPGALAVSMFRKLAQAPQELAGLFDRHAARAGAGRFAKWQLLYWSQLAAVAFNVAALATAIGLVTFTDLAFGWSTTLEADPAAVNRIVQAIAWPWRAIAPGAVPSATLVELSQFFRLEAPDSINVGASRALGGWWPFTIFAIVTYGLLPRLLLLALAIARLRAATAALLLEDPRVTALLVRMASPAIETAALEHDEAHVDEAAPTAAGRREITGTAHAVIWEGSLEPDSARDYARRRLGLDLAAIAEAGGSRGFGADHEALEQIAAGGARTLVVFTPAWEPPLLELLDFLAALRRRVGNAVSIIVTPVPDEARNVSAIEHDTWARAVGRLADPHLYVETGAA